MCSRVTKLERPHVFSLRVHGAAELACPGRRLLEPVPVEAGAARARDLEDDGALQLLGLGAEVVRRVEGDRDGGHVALAVIRVPGAARGGWEAANIVQPLVLEMVLLLLNIEIRELLLKVNVKVLKNVKTCKKTFRFTLA